MYICCVILACPTLFKVSKQKVFILFKILNEYFTVQLFYFQWVKSFLMESMQGKLFLNTYLMYEVRNFLLKFCNNYLKQHEKNLSPAFSLAA